MKTFIVTITDTVDWGASIEAPDEETAHARAWELWGSDARERHFIDRSETTLTIEGDCS